MTRGDAARPILAGVVVALVGFTSSFAIVLQGLRAVGASRDEAASGLLVLCVTMGVVAIGLSLRHRMPISIAWSTPGAALLVGAGPVHGGYAAALGAFLLAGVLTVVVGLLAPARRAIEAIPGPIASALLAGVLFRVCLAPVDGITDLPELTAPVIVTWAVLYRLARPWAVPGALVAAGIAIALDGAFQTGSVDHVAPVLTWTTPAFDVQTLLALGLPLFVVTMASQNLTGLSVLALCGYRPPLAPILSSTGLASAIGAPFGAHGINLAAITQAMAAGPDAHPDPARRWPSAVTAGALYCVLGLGAGLVTAVVAASPPVVVESVAGLALIGALTASLAAATADDRTREAAVVTFLVAASGMTALGMGGPFWGVVAGLAFLGLQHVGQRGDRGVDGVDDRPAVEADEVLDLQVDDGAGVVPGEPEVRP